MYLSSQNYKDDANHDIFSGNLASEILESFHVVYPDINMYDDIKNILFFKIYEIFISHTSKITDNYKHIATVLDKTETEHIDTNVIEDKKKVEDMKNLFINPTNITYNNYPTEIDIINDIEYYDNGYKHIQKYKDKEFKKNEQNEINKKEQVSTKIYEIRKGLSGIVTDYLINHIGDKNILFKQLKFIAIVYK